MSPRTLTPVALSLVLIILLVSPVLPKDVSISVTPLEFVWPLYVENNTVQHFTVTVTNNGDELAECNVLVNAISPAAGWLSVTNNDFDIPAGIGNVVSFDIVVTAPSAYAEFLEGVVHILSNAPQNPEISIAIKLWSGPDIEPPGIYDTVASSDDWDKGLNEFVALTMSNHGEQGHMGIGHVNMDFVTGGTDCDTDATVYMKSSSPLVMIKHGSQVSITTSHYSTNVGSGFTWVPLPGSSISGGLGSLYGRDYDSVFTGRMANRDTSLWIERTFFAPRNNAAMPNFVAVRTVLGADRNITDSIMIGDITDWDIPSDALGGITSPNTSSVTPPFQQQFVYFRGFTDSAGCVLNSTRYATNAFLRSYSEGDVPCGDGSDDFWGAWGVSAEMLAFDSITGEPPVSWWNSLRQRPGLWSTPDLVDQGQFLTYEFLPGMSAGDRRIYWTTYVTGYDMSDPYELVEAVQDAGLWAEVLYGPCTLCGYCYLGIIDGDPCSHNRADISDMTSWIDLMFINPRNLICEEQGNIDLSGDELVTVGDYIVMYEDYYLTQVTLPTCGTPLIPMQLWDQGERDSVLVNIVPPTPYGDDSTLLFEVYLYNDLQRLKGCAMGWTWDDPNMTLVGMELSPEAEAVFDQSAKGDILGRVPAFTADNGNRLFGLTEATFGSWANGSTPRLLATFTFRIPGWSINDTIIFRDTSFNHATNLTFTYTDLKSYPPWSAGEIVYYDTDYDDDGRPNVADNCPFIANPGQEDADSNGVGDACEPCCMGTYRGNVDGDPSDIVSLGDLTALINLLFINLGDPWCWEEANLDGSLPERPNSLSLGDLTKLIDILFISLSPPPPCP